MLFKPLLFGAVFLFFLFLCHVEFVETSGRSRMFGDR